VVKRHGIHREEDPESMEFLKRRSWEMKVLKKMLQASRNGGLNDDPLAEREKGI
ncbi:hypothetical protein HPP92_027311, partial [Vanilla planifolia]